MSPSSQHSLTNSDFLTSCESLFSAGPVTFSQLFSAFFSKGIAECSFRVRAESATPALISVMSVFKHCVFLLALDITQQRKFACPGGGTYYMLLSPTLVTHHEKSGVVNVRL